jgi:hypothetical protein
LKKLNDIWFRVIAIPLIALMGHLVFYNRNESGDERFGFWTIYLISLSETVIIWEVIRLIILYYRRKFPGIQQTRQRILWLLLTCTLATLLIRTVNIWIYDETLFWGYRFPLEGYLHSIFVALLFVLIVGAFYESLYYFNMWHHSSLQAEILKKENLQTQLESLKAQINPHFLFNNLGSLASLIMEDQQRAVDFTEELSFVYRYLLQANEKTLTPLHDELNFVKAYYGVLKKRFEEGIDLVIDTEEKYSDWLIPPLTVQLLLENAVKHNTVMAKAPLRIKIFTSANDRLVVLNSLQEKTTAVDSGKLGLKNIAAKYRLMQQPAVDVIRTETEFIVKIPLIKNS